MIRAKPYRTMLVVLIAIGIVAPPASVQADHRSSPTSSAAAAKKDAPVVRDVELREGGILKGQLVNASGAPLAEQAIQLVRDEQVVATSQTDEAGDFEITGLAGGTYLIDAQQTKAAVRLWTHGTAPPAAADGTLLVAPSQTLRGRFDGPGNGLLRYDEAGVLVAIPLIIGGGAVFQKDKQDKDDNMKPAS